MSAKTLIIATALLAASTAMTVPAFAAGGDGTGPDGNGPGPNGNPPPAVETLPVRAQVMFGLLDTNHDGAVDKDEFAVISSATFAALDTNHDGKLTQEELGARFGAMLGGAHGPGDRGGNHWNNRDGRGWGQGRMDDRHGPGMMGRMASNDGPRFGGRGPQGGPPSFADLDTNHDGSISQDEFNAAMPGPGNGNGPGR